MYIVGILIDNAKVYFPSRSERISPYSTIYLGIMPFQQFLPGYHTFVLLSLNISRIFELMEFSILIGQSFNTKIHLIHLRISIGNANKNPFTSLCTSYIYKSCLVSTHLSSEI
jgi:hypothetical protein